MTDGPQNFTEFWPHYVLAHRGPVTRAVHASGTILGWALLITAIYLQKPWLVLAALVVPYALSWCSHFLVERNLPASFGHPLWAFAADQKMLALILTGKMGDEVRRCAEES